METFKSKYVIIYANHIWQSNNESEAIARLDSDLYIVCSLVRDEQQLYSMVHPLTKKDKEELENRYIEKTSVYDED